MLTFRSTHRGDVAAQRSAGRTHDQRAPGRTGRVPVPPAGVAPRRGEASLPDGLDVIDLGIGEPQHQPPALLAETVARNAHLWNRYPPVNGTAEYRAAAAGWLSRRYDLPAGTVDPDRNLLPLAGTKEGIYLLAACVVPPRKNGARPVVMMPNPVYAVYQGAAVMAGAEPVMLAATRDSGFLPDLDSLDPQLLARTALFYLCTPANPQGAAADMTYLRRLVRLARQHGFVLSVDECYTELWDRSRRPAGSPRRWPRTARSTTWSCCTRCRSARTPPACAPASSPAMRG
ncbi:MAG: aminotransferase class I/II-fold pyridoxal phosphate-dependent enzyme [Geminicoccaceae bacterium]